MQNEPVTTGYFDDHDIWDTGAYAQHLLSSSTVISVDLRLLCLSASLREGTWTPAPPGTLDKVRRQVRRTAAPLSPQWQLTMFGKTLTAFRYTERPDELTPVMLDIPYAHISVPHDEQGLLRAEELHKRGWLAAVASAALRRVPIHSSTSEALGVLKYALANVTDIDSFIMLAKCFTTPPWRSNNHDLLLGLHRTQTDCRMDRSFPELQSERAHRLWAPDLMRYRGWFYFITDVHGLFLGSGLTTSTPTIFDAVGPHLWAARVGNEDNLMRALDTAFCNRLNIAAKLRTALCALSTTVKDSGGVSFYTRGDGIEGVVPDRQSLKQLATTAMKTELISGVGATRLIGGEPLPAILRRTEFSLAITKLAAAAGATQEASLQVETDTRTSTAPENVTEAIRKAKRLQWSLAAARLGQRNQ